MRIVSFALMMLSCCFLLACENAEQKKVDQWLGKWIGPEGTYLVLSKQNDAYEINIQSLDYLKSYDGKRVGDHIEFVRDKKTETLTAGNGEDTGMKWLLDKKNCLVIQKSEGFCRD